MRVEGVASVDRVNSFVQCAGDISAALKDVADLEPMFLATAEKEEALVALTRARSQLDALTARVLAAADDVGQGRGLRDAAAWLAVETRTTRRAARADLVLGRALTEHPDVAHALASAQIRAEQASVSTLNIMATVLRRAFTAGPRGSVAPSSG